MNRFKAGVAVALASASLAPVAMAETKPGSLDRQAARLDQKLGKDALKLSLQTPPFNGGANPDVGTQLTNEDGLIHLHIGRDAGRAVVPEGIRATGRYIIDIWFKTDQNGGLTRLGAPVDIQISAGGSESDEGLVRLELAADNPDNPSQGSFTFIGDYQTPDPYATETLYAGTDQSDTNTDHLTSYRLRRVGEQARHILHDAAADRAPHLFDPAFATRPVL